VQRQKDVYRKMRSSSEGTDHGAPPTGLNHFSASSGQLPDPARLLSLVEKALDDAKAENVVTIDLKGKTSIGDHMIVASGRSQRHVGAVADQLVKLLKQEGFGRARVEGMPQCDWVLIDTGDIVIHIFRPEVREFYNLEKMWSADRPIERLAV
jgi:ribosome-associated protein